MICMGLNSRVYRCKYLTSRETWAPTNQNRLPPVLHTSETTVHTRTHACSIMFIFTHFKIKFEIPNTSRYPFCNHDLGNAEILSCWDALHSPSVRASHYLKMMFPARSAFQAFTKAKSPVMASSKIKCWPLNSLTCRRQRGTVRCLHSCCLVVIRALIKAVRGAQA